MKKRLFFAWVCAIQMLFAVAQDEQRSVDVKVNGREPVELEFSTCTLAITAQTSRDSEVTLDIDLRNETSNHIILFDHIYIEKSLKKAKIRFDKKSYGSTSRRIIPCEGVGEDDILKITPGGNSILTIDGITDDRVRCELPLYIARNKKICKKKFFIMSRVRLVLNVNLIAEKKVDDKYDEVCRKYETLALEVRKNPICPRASHPTTKEMQKRPYIKRINEIKDEISAIKLVHGWRENSEEYQKYKELIVRLDEIVFEEEYCGQCAPAVSTHKCKYCTMSPSEVLDELVRIFMELDGGRIRKDKAISMVQPYRKAWQGGCLKLKHKMSTDATKRESVDKYYKAILNFELNDEQ